MSNIRLARPVARDRSAARRASRRTHNMNAMLARWPFAAISLPKENPLTNITANFDFPWVGFGEDADGPPNRRRLNSVLDFYQYTDKEDSAFFEQLDSDGDGFVTADDLKDCLSKNNLPPDYATQFIKRARGARWWSNAITFGEFKTQLGESEKDVVRAFCQLDVDSRGSIDISKIKASLGKLGLPATDGNAAAMMRALGKAEDASIAYGEFRRFAVLMPRDKLMRDTEASVTWFECATCVPLSGKSEEADGTFKVLLKAALAGGLSSGLSTLMLHPLDTLKTRVQSIPGASIASIVKEAPTLGRKAIYRGIIPSTGGAFSSHGIRTCAYEAGLMALASLGLPYMKAQPLAAFAGTFVGTLVRIPCEVLKQQLQRGNHPNVKVAFTELQRIDGAKGLFRGAGALMFREVPFYVFGMVFYEQYKRVFNGTYFDSCTRDLASWQYIGIGALAGATASFLTTPADVIKSRMMTAAAGSDVRAGAVIVELIQKEGALALFKGALPRAVWIAPLGAMNFAGYELAKRAMGVTSAGTTEGVSEGEAGAAPPAQAAAPDAAAAAQAEGGAASGESAEGDAAQAGSAAEQAGGDGSAGAEPSAGGAEGGESTGAAGATADSASASSDVGARAHETASAAPRSGSEAASLTGALYARRWRGPAQPRLPAQLQQSGDEVTQNHQAIARVRSQAAYAERSSSRNGAARSGRETSQSVAPTACKTCGAGQGTGSALQTCTGAVGPLPAFFERLQRLRPRQQQGAAA